MGFFRDESVFQPALKYRHGERYLGVVVAMNTPWVTQPPRKRAVRGRRKKSEGIAKDEILRAAQRLFPRQNIHEISLRAIAREAEVDPALVLYYFASKEDLLFEALGATLRPLLKGVFRTGPLRPGVGKNAVTQFLRFWDSEARGKTFATLIQTAASEGRLARGLRKFFAAQIAKQFIGRLAEDELPTRVGLVATQLFGLAGARYVFRLEPIASASIETLARSIGPTLDRYLLEPMAA